MMAILIKDMEMPESCFLCRFCRRQEYGEYVGEDTAWSCVASKKRITDGRDLIATFKHPDCPLVEVCTLVEVPDEQPDRNAKERYEDLCEYFKDCSDKGMGILGDRKEFKAWLERLHWHVVKCDELGRELEKLQSAQPEKRTDKRTETLACDSVNRQAAIDAINTHFGFNIEEEYGSAVQEVINGLPSAQPEQQWIPVTERLPDDNREVEITCEIRRFDGKKYRYTCHASYVHRYSIESTDHCNWDFCDEYNEEEDKYYVLSGWYERVHNWDDYSYCAIEDFVIAWRELPEPYGGEQDDQR